MKADAEKRVRVSLVLEAIATAENVTVSEEEVNAEIEKMSSQFGMTTDQIKTALGGTAVLENDLKTQKTVEILVENAKIS